MFLGKRRKIVPMQHLSIMLFRQNTLLVVACVAVGRTDVFVGRDPIEGLRKGEWWDDRLCIQIDGVAAHADFHDAAAVDRRQIGLEVGGEKFAE